MASCAKSAALLQRQRPPRLAEICDRLVDFIINFLGLSGVSLGFNAEDLWIKLGLIGVQLYPKWKTCCVEASKKEICLQTPANIKHEDVSSKKWDYLNNYEMGNIEPPLLWFGGRQFGGLYEREIHTEPHTQNGICCVWIMSHSHLGIGMRFERHM